MAEEDSAALVKTFEYLSDNQIPQQWPLELKKAAGRSEKLEPIIRDFPLTFSFV